MKTNWHHGCHAVGCKVLVAPRFLMCPRVLKRQVYDTYRPGQEVNKKPSVEYRRVAREAILWVRDAEEEKT